MQPEAGWSWLGRVGYRSAVELQESLRADVRQGGREILLLLEHEPVVTLGRNADTRNLRLSLAELQARGIELQQSSRGGDVTYHGPGQLVGYPVFRLRRGVRAHMENMAACLLDVLANLGIAAEWSASRPGLWVKAEKICAFGIHVRHGIAIHGFALNVSTAMEGFATIVPCGLRDAGVTSVKRQLGCAPPVEAIARSLPARFAERFGMRLRELPSGVFPIAIGWRGSLECPKS